MALPKIIVVIGPTAVGKTKISVEIAKKLNTEIISADSMQIYKCMDIGTAKVTESETLGVKHHMIDIIDPDESFSVSEFQKEVFKIINELHIGNKIPVIAGGSGLYINSIIYDLDFSQTRANEEVRNYYYSIYEKKGSAELIKLLKQVDPISAQKIHEHNIKRIIRALEVYKITGKPYSELNINFRQENCKFNFIIIGLTMERELLYRRINSRVDEMINEGLFDEVSHLYKKGYDENLVSMQGIGYKEIISYLKGEIDRTEAIRILKRDTRRFAKRQFTWFSKDKRIKWFNIEENNFGQSKSNIYNYILNRLKED